ncbi:MAG: hypothetical protein D6770_10500 [Anaerolineae bacterium]|nr:MAG: hypothetical protein D6770_10500 [Anaerolineae bacterium]
MTEDDLGFFNVPANGLGIVRARTLLGNLRLWDVPRNRQALDIVIHEIGSSPLPGLYLLLDDERGNKKVYIGQTEDLEKRLSTHINDPERKIRNWQHAILINDGRNASQSDLNDENIRLMLEDYLVRLFQINSYKVVTRATRQPSLSAQQATLVKAFKREINILLSRMGKISHFLRGRRDDLVYLDDAKRILERYGHRVQKWGEKYATVDGHFVVIRPGSQKPKGWQVTFRGSKSLSALKQGQGYLLMPRGNLVLLPLRMINEFVLSVDTQALSRDTVDVFVRFDDDKIMLVYKHGEIEITDYSVGPYP